MASACLSTRYRTGLYTSPHLIRVNERFRIDEVDIDSDLLGQRLAQVLDVIGLNHELTYFELGTVVAFWHFAQERVQVAVLETGLGGRLDATAACSPLVVGLTPIAMDHVDLLGHSLPAIAREKSGIIKPGVRVICSRQAPEALGVVGEKAAGCSAELRLEGRDFGAVRGDAGLDFEGKRWHLKGLTLPLAGPHQVQNAAVALACLEALGECGFSLKEDDVRCALPSTRWPGRLELFAGRPHVLLDGAHNSHGVDALCSALDAAHRGQDVHLIFSVFSDKDSEPMMRRLFPRCSSVHLTALDNSRSKPPASYVDLARALAPTVIIHRSPREALEAARLAASPQGLVLGAGSLFLVGALRQLLSDERGGKGVERRAEERR